MGGEGRRLRPSAWLDLIFFRTWWRYRPGETPWLSVPYHLFNLGEGTVWLVFAGLVLRRHVREPRSRLEVWYALAFLTFGLTDLRESYALDSWLIWAKLVTLIVLLRLRSIVIARYYPGSKLY